ncbi:MAG: helix-turn-helix domain-containing protein [Anaeromassilibacillus sp.]
MRYTLEELCTKKENQVFDRKSARKDAKGLSNHIVAFANADGGTLVIGVEDNGEITGIDAYTNNINDILRVPFDYCNPSVRVTTETVECKDKDGNLNHLLIMTIPQSSELHANQQDEVYYRMGDKSKKLNFDERLQLMYAKGSRYYEDEPVFRSTLDDIDMDFVAEYCKKIGYEIPGRIHQAEQRLYCKARRSRGNEWGCASSFRGRSTAFLPESKGALYPL